MSVTEWLRESGWMLSPNQAGLLVAAAMMAISLWILLPSRHSAKANRRILGAVFGAIGLSVLWSFVPRMQLTVQAEFCAMAAITIACAAATIASHSPVYSAIWFAASLLGTAGLLLFQGAQFLGVATVAVYAGAIVVTFLFVLMLAQPGGHAYFDRMSWGKWPRCVSPVVAACFLIVIVVSLAEIDETPSVELHGRLGAVLAEVDPNAQLRAVRRREVSPDEVSLRVRVAAPRDSRDRLVAHVAMLRRAAENVLTGDKRVDVSMEFIDVLSPNHVAHFGGQLFGRHLIAVQVAAVLLLVALVGAIAIASRDADVPPAPGDST